MIIDRRRLSGDEAYFKDASSNINLAASLPAHAQTQAPGIGRQIEVSGIHFYLEGNDLRALFRRQSRVLLRITLMKEILPGLFADPYANRVHAIAGFEDFNEGTFTNCQALEVEGEPAIVAMSPGKCSWKSTLYMLPSAVNIVGAAWSLASARSIPNVTSASNFTYTVTLTAWGNNGSQLTTPASQNLTPLDKRSSAMNVSGVRQFQIEFGADTSADGYFHERHAAVGLGQIGRSLLRGLYLLEAVPSQHEFQSLAELTAEASGYDLLGATNDPLTRLAVTLRFPATLVTGPNEDVSGGRYEFIAIDVDPDKALPAGALTYLSARLSAQEVLRPPAASAS